MKKIIALLLALIMVFSLVACAAKEEPKAEEPEAPKAEEPKAEEPKEEEPKEEEPEEPAEPEVYTITTLAGDASTVAGKMPGFRGEVMKKYGVEVETWSFDEGKKQAILASGDLPDIMIMTRDELNQLGDAAADLFLDLTPYMNEEYLPHYNSSNGDYDKAIQATIESFGWVVGAPRQIGLSHSLTNSLDTISEQLPKLNWQYYKAAGYPEVTDMASYLDAIEKMVETTPEVDGEATIGIMLENSINNVYFGNAGMYMNFFGYAANPNLVEWNRVTNEMSYMLDDDSLYKEAMMWFAEANHRGLLDPDSISNDFMTQWAKVRHTMGGGGTVMGWSPEGYHELVIDGTAFLVGEMNYNANNFLCVAKDTENLEGVLQYMDNQLNPNYNLEIQFGPAGYIWDVDEDGNAYVTENAMNFGMEYGGFEGFPMANGESWTAFIYGALINQGYPTTYGDGDGGYVHSYLTSWKQWQIARASTNENYADWRAFTGYDSGRQWVEDLGLVHEVKNYAFGTISDEMALIRDAAAQILINEGWKIVFSADMDEAEAIWDQMVADVEALGMKDVYEWAVADMQAVVNG